MNIEFYISPYQVLEAELNPGKARKAEVTNVDNFFSTTCFIKQRSLPKLRKKIFKF